MIFNMSGGGGSDLNFSVVGSPTQPENPRENTIWVKTETKIPSWVFSPTTPTNPEGGILFFKTALTSSVGFNALRKNEIAILPTSAQQYIGGQWKNMEAHAYIGGTWVQFDWEVEYLYKNGVISDTLGGGMTPVATHFADTSGSKPTVTIGTSSIIVSNFALNKSGAAYFNKPLDLTNWKTLYIRAQVKGKDVYHAHFGLGKNTNALLPIENNFASNVTWAETVHKIDVSNLSNMLYLGFGAHRYQDSEPKCSIYEIWIE